MADNKTNYVGAPYNFVPFYNEVVEVDQKQMETHGKIEADLLTGEITYTVTAETPIFISDGKKEGTKDISSFVRNERGNCVIPGSSMRGLIRSNAQILGLSSFDDDIDDYNLMYRNVATGAEKKSYDTILGANTDNIGGKKPVSILTNVKAGYLVKEGDEYYICQTDVDKISSDLGAMNYYVLSERIIAEDMKSGRTSFPFFEENPNCLQHIMKEGFQKVTTNRQTQYKGKGNELYQEGYHKISYEVTNLRNITAVGNPGEYRYEGYLLCSGKMKNKKVLYIIPKINREKECISISKEDIKAFKIDYNKRLNTLGNNKSFYNLPQKDGEIKPVFYISLDRLYFGFTPRLRLFYDYSIKDGYKQNKKEFDYAKLLFGTIKDKNKDKVGYKSKVAFSDAVLVGNEKKNQEISVILGEPKPTSYLDYLKQSDGETTYNTKGFELRGVKQYWLHNKVKDYSYGKQKNNEKVFTHMKPLEKGSQFKGVVRFQNLSKAELGLLAWSIRLEENFLMNIGMGKALGFGVIQVSDIQLKIFDIESAYNLEQPIDFNPMVEQNITSYIDAYKIEISSKIKEETIEKLSSIQTFFKMHNRNLIPDNEITRYMSLADKEYQSRVKAKIPLDSVEEVIAKSRKLYGGNAVEKKVIENGSMYRAEIKGFQGKKIKLYVEGQYKAIPVEDIKGIEDLNKKNMKEKLPIGTQVSFKPIKSEENTLYEISVL